LRVVDGATAKCYTHSRTGPWQLVILIAGKKSDGKLSGVVLLLAGDRGRSVYDKNRYAKDIRTLIVRGGKSEAGILRSWYIVLLKLTRQSGS